MNECVRQTVDIVMVSNRQHKQPKWKRSSKIYVLTKSEITIYGSLQPQKSEYRPRQNKYIRVDGQRPGKEEMTKTNPPKNKRPNIRMSEK
jgi:hypothetical protein